MISCKLVGGIGNQLFIIFATIAYSMKYNQSFTFLNTEFIGDRKSYWNTFLSPLLKFTTFDKYLMDNSNIIQEQTFHYKEIVKPDEIINTQLVGYFQSYKFFDAYYEKIYRIINLKKIKEEIQYKYIKNFSNMISMHFRLGDYKKLQDYHPILKYEYYKNSIQFIINMTGKSNLNILYFCELDDNDTVSEIIMKLQDCYPECIFEKADDGIVDWKQMIMMSMCRHNIIANSTFSWWGAYFNTREDKIVCYPDIWFGRILSHNITVDLFPEKWYKINSI